MFRPVARTALRTTSNSTVAFASRRTQVTRRWASTTGADKPRSWKSGLVRWGLAGAAVYYYNTSNVFAEEAHDQYAHHPPPAPSETEDLRTLDSYAKKPKASLSPTTEAASIPVTDGADAPITAGGPADLEAEADQQGAFNPETGEINWDCPCLGGMANGPCGEEFKAAFSCFVYSNEEPKGVDCIEKFKGMQDCFRAHPDVYGAELEDDEYEAEPVVEGEGQGEGLTAIAKDAANEIDAKVRTGVDGVKTDAIAVADKAKETADQVQADVAGATERAKAAAKEVKEKHIETSESEELVPKAWHDAKGAPEPSQEKSDAKSA